MDSLFNDLETKVRVRPLEARLSVSGGLDSQRPDGQLSESTNLDVSKVVIAGKELICVDRYKGGVDCNWEAYNAK